MMFCKDFNKISGINQGEGARVLKPPSSHAPPPGFTLNCEIAVYTADVSNIKYQDPSIQHISSRPPLYDYCNSIFHD